MPEPETADPAAAAAPSQKKFHVFVEHCVDCHLHQGSTSHNPRKYVGIFNKIALALLEAFPAVPFEFVGNPVEPRLGSFEVWCRDESGADVMLYSKIKDKNFCKPEAIPQVFKWFCNKNKYDADGGGDPRAGAGSKLGAGPAKPRWARWHSAPCEVDDLMPPGTDDAMAAAKEAAAAAGSNSPRRSPPINQGGGGGGQKQGWDRPAPAAAPKRSSQPVAKDPYGIAGVNGAMGKPPGDDVDRSGPSSSSGGVKKRSKGPDSNDSRDRVCSRWGCQSCTFTLEEQSGKTHNGCSWHPGKWDFGSPQGWWPAHWTCCHGGFDEPGCTKGLHSGPLPGERELVCINHGQVNEANQHPDSCCGAVFTESGNEEGSMKCRYHSGLLDPSSGEWSCCGATSVGTSAQDLAAGGGCVEADHKAQVWPHPLSSMQLVYKSNRTRQVAKLNKASAEAAAAPATAAKGGVLRKGGAQPVKVQAKVLQGAGFGSDGNLPPLQHPFSGFFENKKAYEVKAKAGQFDDEAKGERYVCQNWGCAAPNYVGGDGGGGPDGNGKAACRCHTGYFDLGSKMWEPHWSCCRKEWLAAPCESTRHNGVLRSKGVFCAHCRRRFHPTDKAAGANACEAAPEGQHEEEAQWPDEAAQGRWKKQDLSKSVPDFFLVISHFYRDKAVFDILQRRVFTELLKLLSASQESSGASVAGPGSPSKGGKVRCWAAGCAAGEEVYTLEMLWSEHVKKVVGSAVDLEIVGTDADPNIIQRATEATFDPAAITELPEDLQLNGFTGGNKTTRLVTVKPEYTRNTSFHVQDIREETPPGMFHIILNRNFTYKYMNKKQQREVLDKHLAQLVPGGFICVGEKERVDDPRCPMFQGAEGKGIYRYTGPLLSGEAGQAGAGRGGGGGEEEEVLESAQSNHSEQVASASVPDAEEEEEEEENHDTADVAPAAPPAAPVAETPPAAAPQAAQEVANADLSAATPLHSAEEAGSPSSAPVPAPAGYEDDDFRSTGNFEEGDQEQDTDFLQPVAAGDDDDEAAAENAPLVDDAAQDEALGPEMSWDEKLACIDGHCDSRPSTAQGKPTEEEHADEPIA